MKADAMVILGGGINADGSLQGPSSRRVELAAELFSKNQIPIIVSSKWSFQLDFTPERTIAAAMKADLMGRNVPAEKIFLEDQSYDTIGNIYFTKLILKQYGWKRITVITSEFQQKRAAYLCKRILGSEFQVDFVIAKNGLEGEALKEQRKIERELLTKIQIFSKLFKFKDGDDEAIKKLLQKHPAYNFVR